MAFRDTQERTVTLGIAEWANLPVHERVLDRLADLLFEADEILDMLGAEDAARMRWVAPCVRSVYEQVNELMKQLAD